MDDRQAIARVCKAIFNGNPNPDVLKESGWWVSWVTDIVMPCLDSERGDWLQFPFEGTVMDQPYMSFEICKLVRLNYQIHLSNKMKQMMQKSKSSR